MAGRTPKVVVIGAAYVDMAIKCSQVPTPGQAVSGSGLSYSPAGPGPNQAVQAALCGCQVYLLSKIGGDPFGEMIKSDLAERNIDTSFVYIAEAKNTGTIVTLVNATGENASCISSGANNALLPTDIEVAESAIAQADVCLVHAQLPRDTVAAAIRCAKLHAIPLILDPASPIDQHQHPYRTLPLEYFQADILIPNLYEAAQITEHSDVNIRTAKLIGSELLGRGIRSAVITMGKKGCMVLNRHTTTHIPAFEVDLVDKTGTGDAFAAALAAHYAVENNITKAVKFASAAGALACTKFGSIESMPTKAEIIELLQQYDTD